VLEYCYTGNVRIPKEDSTLGLKLMEAADRVFFIYSMLYYSDFSSKVPIRRLEIPIGTPTYCKNFAGKCVRNVHKVSSILLDDLIIIYLFSAKFFDAKKLKEMSAQFICMNYQQIAFGDTDFEILFSILEEGSDQK
jgi:hypothetical protein